MQLADYQREAFSFHAYGDREYLSWGLTAEAGEVHGVVARIYRGDNRDFEASFLDECGDCLWMLAVMCEEKGIEIADIGVARDIRPMARNTAAERFMRLAIVISDDFKGDVITGQNVGVALRYLELIANRSIEEIADRNIEKLSSRKERGVIKGSGDNR